MPIDCININIRVINIPILCCLQIIKLYKSFELDINIPTEQLQYNSNLYAGRDS